jgi:site-specific recombinase XerC
MAQTSLGSDDDAALPELCFPQWFSAFLADRAVRKPSPHTAKAYRQDFAAIVHLMAADRARIGELTPAAITKEAMRAAFGAYADTHSAASIRRCWSTWNTLCTFLFTAELLDANPMPLIGRPKVPKSLPKGLGAGRSRGC